MCLPFTDWSCGDACISSPKPIRSKKHSELQLSSQAGKHKHCNFRGCCVQRLDDVKVVEAWEVVYGCPGVPSSTEGMRKGERVLAEERCVSLGQHDDNLQV